MRERKPTPKEKRQKDGGKNIRILREANEGDGSLANECGQTTEEPFFPHSFAPIRLPKNG